MALTKITKTGITDAAVESAKVGADAIDATKIADDAISEEHLDNTAITGFSEETSVQSTDQILVYDQSSGTIKKISQTNIMETDPVLGFILAGFVFIVLFNPLGLI